MKATKKNKKNIEIDYIANFLSAFESRVQMVNDRYFGDKRNSG